MKDRLEVGMVIKTSYNTGPYILKEISELCNCKSPMSELNGVSGDRDPHYHMVLTNTDGRDEFYLNGYAPSKDGIWRSVEHDDFLIIDLPQEGVQTSLF